MRREVCKGLGTSGLNDLSMCTVRDGRNLRRFELSNFAQGVRASVVCWGHGVFTVIIRNG